jgi:hypothetical protein
MIITYHKIKDKVRPFFTLTLIIMNSYIYIYICYYVIHACVFDLDTIHDT